MSIPPPRAARAVGSHRLAEGPVWDPVRERVLWVDIPAGRIRTATLTSDGDLAPAEQVSVGGSVGAVAVSADDHWIIAGATGILQRDASGLITAGARVLPGDSGRRLNDGKPDPAGRFVVGSLRSDGDSSTEVLVRIESDDSVTTLDDDLALSNGLAWTRDGSCMFSVDTLRRVIHRRSYDPSSGGVGPRTDFAHVDDGLPDGICLDAEEHLWVAIWGRGEVRRLSPSGDHVDTVTVPAPLVSSVAFVGKDLRSMVITTAAGGLTTAERQRHPLSGHLFLTEPDTPGLPMTAWSRTERG
ncbi:SMP-30/gluconolactonase/LRE family protein [Propionibacteriaceae bacterium Y2011]